jgi:hypothetical protein
MEAMRIQGADLHIFTFVLVGTRRTTLDYANDAGDSYDAAESVAFP